MKSLKEGKLIIPRLITLVGMSFLIAAGIVTAVVKIIEVI